MKKILTSLPAWTFSVIWLLIILCLMLIPTADIQWFAQVVKEQDGFCHFIMGGVMLVCVAFDLQRRRQWNRLPWPSLLLLAMTAFCLTGLFEVAQIWIPPVYHRWFDWTDLYCQLAGALSLAIVYGFVQRLWCRRKG